jgi:hypothetical protein
LSFLLQTEAGVKNPAVRVGFERSSAAKVDIGVYLGELCPEVSIRWAVADEAE